MLSTHGIASQNVSRVSGTHSLLGNTELPETGAFDFLNYLLGLQVNSADSFQGQDAPFTDLGKEAESVDPKDPLQALFQKKEQQPLWNPMIPAGMSAVQASPLQPLPSNVNAENDRMSVLSESSDNEKPTQSNQLLENRLLEPKLFIETRESGMDVGSAGESQDPDKSDGAGQLASALSDVQKSKGIEKYNELSQLKSQQAKHNENLNSLKTVGETGMESRIGSEVNDVSMGEVKSAEKKRGADQDSSLVVLNSTVQTSKIFDGSTKLDAGSQVGEKVTLPEVFKKVESMIHHGGGKMTVQLSPPELGKLEVDVVTKGNQVEIKMRSDNDLAKVTLESHMGELKNAMEGQNLTLHKAEVHVGLDQGRSFEGGQFAAFSKNDQGGFNQRSSQQSHRNAIPSYRSEANLRSVSSVSRSSFGVKPSGGIDIRI